MDASSNNKQYTTNQQQDGRAFGEHASTQRRDAEDNRASQEKKLHYQKVEDKGYRRTIQPATLCYQWEQNEISKTTATSKLETGKSEQNETDQPEHTSLLHLSCIDSREAEENQEESDCGSKRHGNPESTKRIIIKQLTNRPNDGKTATEE